MPWRIVRDVNETMTCRRLIYMPPTGIAVGEIGAETMDQGGQDGREKALQLHRAGQLGPARAAYEALLAQAPGDADLLGLAGVLALQEERTGEAEALFGRSLAAGGEARIHLRNLNNYLALLKEARRDEDARALIAGGLPEWPEGAVPDAVERGTVLSLTEALARFGEPGRALALLEGVLPFLGDDAEVLNLAGRFRLMQGDAEAALTALERAAARDPGNWQALAALSAAYDRLGRRAEARQAAARFARASPVHIAPRHQTQQAAILVLNNAPKWIENPNVSARALHLSINYISQLSQQKAAEYRFISMFVDLPDPGPEIPPADVVFNNMASAEAMNVPGRLDRAVALVERIGLPVINHPRAIFETTRQKNAERLRGIPGLKVPRIERYRTDLAPVEQIVADIDHSFDYPVILRHATSHMSANLQHSETGSVSVLVPDGDSLRAHIEKLGWLEFYAVEYVDLRKKAGYFRKIRAACFDDEVIIPIVGCYSGWMVAGARSKQVGIDFYRSHPETIEISNRIARDPEGVLGAECLRTLEAIRDRMPLDQFGVDFDVDEDGTMVLFEANSAMNFLPHPGEPADVVLPPEPFERVNAAFHRLVRRKIDGGA